MSSNVNFKLLGVLLFWGSVVISIDPFRLLVQGKRRRFMDLFKFKIFPTGNKRCKYGNLHLPHKLNDRADTWRNLRSDNSDLSNCELVVKNNLNEIIVICWIDENGVLHHFYPINDNSIRDGSVNPIHVEFTKSQHAFVFIRQRTIIYKKISDINDKVLLYNAITTDIF